MTEAERWQAVKQLFERAVELDDEARTKQLDEARAASPTIAAEVQSLLDWDARRDGPLDAGLAPFNLSGGHLPDGALVGTQLGSWRVVGVIGGGGMGVVYRAERADAAFRMPAAIKVVRRGADGSRVLERFLRERETLAALDHPNVARLLDGGTTPQGQPYFVMELVDGVRIDRYCDEHGLSIDARLDLFRAVCDAVRYAHQALVVHRDIKPDKTRSLRDRPASAGRSWRGYSRRPTQARRHGCCARRSRPTAGWASAIATTCKRGATDSAGRSDWPRSSRVRRPASWKHAASGRSPQTLSKSFRPAERQAVSTSRTPSASTAP